MNTTETYPQVPGSAGSNRGVDVRRGSSSITCSNLGVGFDCRTTLTLATYKVRTLRSDEMIVELEEEVDKLH